MKCGLQGALLKKPLSLSLSLCRLQSLFSVSFLTHAPLRLSPAAPLVAGRPSAIRSCLGVLSSCAIAAFLSRHSALGRLVGLVSSFLRCAAALCAQARLGPSCCAAAQHRPGLASP